MEIRILEERSNPLMKRHEYRFEVAHATAATPSRDAVRGELSKLVKAPKDRVIIERMHARFGTATTRGDALVYETAEAAKSITRAHILVRNGLKEKESKPGPSASPPAPAEAPKPAPSAPSAPAKAEEPPPAAAPAEPKAKPVKTDASKPGAEASEAKTKPAKGEKAHAPKAE